MLIDITIDISHYQTALWTLVFSQHRNHAPLVHGSDIDLSLCLWSDSARLHALLHLTSFHLLGATG